MMFNPIKSFLVTGIVLFVFASLTTSTNAATLFENFDNPSVSAPNYNGIKIKYPSGDWYSYGITKPTNPDEKDRINGLYSIRMSGLSKQNTLYMMFDNAGAGVVSFNYGSYSNHSGGKFKLEKSTNQGVSWAPISEEITVPAWSGTMLTFSQVVNEPGNVRFRIFMTETSNANTRVNIDDFIITDYNVEQTALPQSSVPTGIYETAQTVSLTSATSGATIHYTLDGTPATSSSPVYTTPLNITETTRIRAIAVAAGKENSREEVVLISFPENLSAINQFYTKLATSGTNLTYFKYTGEAIVTFTYVTSTGRFVYIQDASAGIIINDNFKKLEGDFAIGDKVTGFYAWVNNINSSPQLYLHTNLTVVSKGNIVTPKVITLAQVPEYNYQLVQINNLYFDEADGTIKFNPNTPYTIHDEGSATTSTKFRTPANMTPNFDYNGTIIPAKVNMVGMVAKNSSATTDFMVFARSLSDLNVAVSGIHQPSTLNFRISGKMLILEPTSTDPIEVYTTTGQAVYRQLPSDGSTVSITLEQGIFLVKTGEGIAKVIIP
jgi:hypothetical protein